MTPNTITFLDGREVNIQKLVRYIRDAAHFNSKKKIKEFQKMLDLIDPNDISRLHDMAFPTTEMQDRIQQFKQTHPLTVSINA
jgi:hypothetical protein